MNKSANFEKRNDIMFIQIKSKKTFSKIFNKTYCFIIKIVKVIKKYLIT